MNDNPFLTLELFKALVDLRAYTIIGDRISAAAAWGTAHRELEKQKVDDDTIANFEKMFR